MPTHLRRAAIEADTRATPDPDTLIDAAELRRICGGILPEPRHIERRRFWRRGDVAAALAAHREPPPPSPCPDGPAAREGRHADAA